ncbi:radical SAM protein [Candidatus Woesearchaeota archaeon]|nr:radical SAM protein [Candidatus Woesearchaeota archaeon]
MKIKKTVILMGYSCNNKCIFCCNENKRQKIKDKTTEEVKKDIINAKKSGADYIEFIGGEPTIRKDILGIIAFAKKLDFRTIMIATNGRMFSKKDFARKIIECGLSHIVFSIHGHNAELHDKLTQVPGSFEQLREGIKNLQEIGFKNIGSNTTIVKQNYKNLLEIGKLIFGMGIRNSEFIFVDPTHGATKNNFLEVVPTYEQVSPYVNNLLKFGREIKARHWHVRYYPLCYVNEEYHSQISELHETQTFHTEHIAPDFINKSVEKNRKSIARTKIYKCEKCAYSDKCEGYWKEYLKYYPTLPKKNHQDTLFIWIPVLERNASGRPPFPHFAMLLKEAKQKFKDRCTGLDFSSCIRGLYDSKKEEEIREKREKAIDSIKNKVLGMSPKILVFSATPRSDILFSLELIERLKKDSNTKIIFYSFFLEPKILSCIIRNCKGDESYIATGRKEVLELIEKIYLKKNTDARKINYGRPSEENPVVFDYDDFEGFNIKSYGKRAEIFTSVGCTNKCSFCMHNSCSPRTVFSEDYVKNQLARLSKLYDINAIQIKDSSFNPSCERGKNLLNLFGKFDMRFSLQTRIDSFSKELIKKLENKNLEFFIGIESVFPSIIKFFNKSQNPQEYIDHIKKIIPVIGNSNLKVTYSYIFGSPQEKKEDMDASYEFFHNLKSENTSLLAYPFQIKPGTVHFQSYLNSGIKVFNMHPYWKPGAKGFFSEISPFMFSKYASSTSDFEINFPVFLVKNKFLDNKELFSKLDDISKKIEVVNEEN